MTNTKKYVYLAKPVANTSKPATQKTKQAILKDMTEEEKREAQLRNDLSHATELFGKFKSKAGS